MKKISCVIISFVMLAEMLCFCVSAKEKENINKAAQVLDRIGVIEIPSNGSISRFNKVTRAEFAEYAAKMINAKPIEKKINFSDVNESHWAFESICALVEKGYISGSDNKKFNPDQYISYNEACKILLDLAGYKVYASANGGYPYGYAVIAGNMKVSPFVEDYEALNFGEVIQLIYNIATLGLYEISSAGGDGKKTYEVDAEKTLLSTYHDIYIRRGYITSIYGANMSGFSTSKINEMYLDDEKFNIVEGLKIDDYFTNYTEILFELRNKDSEGNVFFVENIESKNDETLVSLDCFISFDKEKYEINYYHDNNKVQKSREKIYKGASVIYNGRPYKDSLAEVLNEFSSENKKGNIRIKDKDNDGILDLVVIKSYKSYLVSYINADKTVMYSKLNNGDIINTDKFETVITRDRNFDFVNLSDNVPSLINIAESKDSKNIEIIVNNEIISGEVTSLDNSEKTILIDNNLFNVDAQFWNSNRLNISCGKQYKAYIDLFGDVCYMESNTGSDFQIGYLIKGSISEDLRIDKRCCLKMYTEAGEFKIFYIADKVTIDEKSFNNVSDLVDIFDAIPGTTGTIADQDGNLNLKLKRQIIRYKLNKNGEINEIDTYSIGDAEDKRNTLIRHYDGIGQLIYGANTKRFGVDVLYSANDTKLFVVPKIADDGNIYLNNVKVDDTIDLYSRTTTFTHDYQYYLETYNYDYKNPYENIIVVHQENAVESTNLVMFDRLVQAVDGNNGVKNKMYGMSRGGEVSYFIDDTISDDVLNELSQGDVIRIATDPSEKKVTGLYKMFDKKTMSLENNGTNKYWYSGSYTKYGSSYRAAKFQLSLGYAYDIRNGILRWTYELGGEDYECINASSLGISVYDSTKSERNRILTGSLSDIVDYISAGSECSRILFNVTTNNAVQLFVYK